jgi:hypothetical protein
MATIRELLIKAGVRNLREFGYPACDEKNILTDLIYKRFFSQMLEDDPRPQSKELLKEINEVSNG